MEGFKKIGVAGISQLFLHLVYRIALPEKRLCRGDFLQGNIVTDRGMCMLFEQAGQIVRMQVKMLCQVGHGEIVINMLLKVGNHLVNFLLGIRNRKNMIALWRKAVYRCSKKDSSSKKSAIADEVSDSGCESSD